jgi:hypothetical protein
MTGTVIFSEDIPPVEWSETEPLRLEFGPKAATLAALPRAWTPPFALISTRCLQRITGTDKHCLPLGTTLSHVFEIWPGLQAKFTCDQALSATQFGTVVATTASR